MTEERPDWVAWHDRYDEEVHSLRQRLAIVQGFIRDAFERTERSPLRVISMCAGQARDLTGAVEQSGRRDLVGRLVEINPVLADQARTGLRNLGVSDVEVTVGDAGELSAYEGAVPADLVLACGVFGNISDADIETTISALPELCAKGATVIWTRHRRPPDLTLEMRRWQTELGFEDVGFEMVDDPELMGAVGAAVYRGAERPPGALDGRRLFTFDDEMVMRRRPQQT